MLHQKYIFHFFHIYLLIKPVCVTIFNISCFNSDSFLALVLLFIMRWTDLFLCNLHAHLKTDHLQVTTTKCQRDIRKSDLSEDAVVSRLCIQEAFYVTSRVSVNCSRTAGGTAGSTGQTGRHWRLWRSWKTQKQCNNYEIWQVKNRKIEQR